MLFAARFWRAEPKPPCWPYPQGRLSQAKPPWKEGPCICVCRGHAGGSGRQPVCSFPQPGEGVYLPALCSLITCGIRSVPFQTSAQRLQPGSSGELSAFSYLPVWLTTQYMKLWSIELCYLKGFFFPVSFSVLVFAWGMFSGLFLSFFFFPFSIFVRINTL